MSIENLLDHTCDIYHMDEEERSPGYNLPASPSFSYPKEPDVRGQPCHFGVQNFVSIDVIQTAPANLMEASIKLTLPTETDIRLHDKIVDCDTGLDYTAEQPRNIRGHHIIVQIKRKGTQRAL